MSNFKKNIAKTCIFLSLGGIILPVIENSSYIYASEKNLSKIIEEPRELTKYEITLIDKYVEIENNRFYLKDNNELSVELKNLAEQYINKTNQSLDNYKGKTFVDYSSKKILGLSLLSRASGKNDLEWHWNYVRVYVDAGALNIILQGGVAGGLSLLATELSLSPHLGAAIGAMVGQAVQQTDGIWFDYNYFIGILTMNWGYQ